MSRRSFGIIPEIHCGQSLETSAGKNQTKNWRRKVYDVCPLVWERNLQSARRAKRDDASGRLVLPDCYADSDSQRDKA
jgi:hypothetical protein